MNFLKFKLLNTFLMVLSTIFLIITSTLTIFWSLPFIITPLLGLQFYKITEQKLVKLLKKLPKRSSINYNDEHDGWIIGWPYIGYIQKLPSNYGEEKKELYILTTRNFFDKKMKQIDNIEEIDTTSELENQITIWEREGNFFYFYYSKRMFDVSSFEPRNNQISVVNDIKKFYETNRYCVALLHGEKGSGKSMIPILLAKSLCSEQTTVNFCDTFRPTDPNNNFSTLYAHINPSKDSPLIIVLEEFDIIIHQIHYKKIMPHKHIPILIFDKPSWNMFFDRFDRKFYPWVILIMTSNSSPKNINALDPSYIREGRVNLTFHITRNANLN